MVGSLVLGAVAAGVNAGAFFAFSNFVMPALGELEPQDGAAAMQSINRFAPNPLFVAAIIGAALAGVPLLIWRDGSGDTRWVAAAVALSALSFVVTVAFNVPRNNMLDALDAGAPSTEPQWLDYLVTWTRWNTVRTVTSAASVAAYAVALRGR